MKQKLFTPKEVIALHSTDVLTWLKAKTPNRENLVEDTTNAQALYKKLRDTLITQNVSVRSMTDRVQQLNQLIFEKIDEAFNSINLSNFTTIFMDELKTQRTQKQIKIKEECIKKGLMLWHATPLAKAELEDGKLKGKIKRPNLVWEENFTGVCAFPQNKGAYVLKHADEKGGFAAQSDINVCLTDDRLDGKKIYDILGYLHGHRLTSEDGFFPTISLTGEIAPEWTTTKDVSIDESKPVTLKTLVENGVHIFKVNPKDLSLIKQIKSEKIPHNLTREQIFRADIDIMEDMARHPDRIYTDELGQKRKIVVKSYVEEVQRELSKSRSSNLKEVFREGLSFSKTKQDSRGG